MPTMRLMNAAFRMNRAVDKHQGSALLNEDAGDSAIAAVSLNQGGGIF